MSHKGLSIQNYILYTVYYSIYDIFINIFFTFFLDTIITFLEGEKIVEEFVDSHSPLIEDNILFARANLTDANEKLTKIARGQSKVFDCFN